MIWVVDGTRLKNDIVRFLKAMKNFKPFPENKDLYTVENYEKVFPTDWLESKVPVFIDFLGENAPDGSRKDDLICIFPKRKDGKIVFCGIKREKFVQRCKENTLVVFLNKLFSKLSPTSQPSEKEKIVRRSNYSFRPINVDSMSAKKINKWKDQGYNFRF